MGIGDQIANLFRRRRRSPTPTPSATSQPSAGRLGVWRRIANAITRRRARSPGPADSGGGGGIGGVFRGPTGAIGSVRVIIGGRFVSMAGTKIYGEWSGTIDTDRGNQPPSPANATLLAQALTNQNPTAVIDAINTILTLDYAGRTPTSQGGFSFYGPTEGLRILRIQTLTITWT